MRNIGLVKQHYVSYYQNITNGPPFEAVDDNPYLDNFYEDMQRWSFNLQVYFLNSRFRQVQDIAKSKKTIIQDRTIYEDAYVLLQIYSQWV